MCNKRLSPRQLLYIKEYRYMGCSDVSEFEHICGQILQRRHLVCTADRLHEQEWWILMR